MRVAAVYDVHGNLPALEAVLAEVERARVDDIVFGGDLVPGPFPAEALELALSTGGRFVMGNADRALLGELDAVPSERQTEFQWCRERLAREQLGTIAAFEPRISLEIDGLGPTLFCHAVPASDEPIFTPWTPPGRLRELFAGVEERLVVVGHTHVQFLLPVGGRRVANAGSVGMPYADRPGAYWAALGPGIEFRRTEYDVDAAAERIRRSGWPAADEFVAENLLEVPTAEEAIEVFERMAAEGA